jgi:hypothetical protein
VIFHLEMEPERYERGIPEDSAGVFVSYPSRTGRSSPLRSLPTLIGVDVSTQADEQVPAHHGAQVSVLSIPWELQQVPGLRSLTNSLSTARLFSYAPAIAAKENVYLGLDRCFDLDKVIQAAVAFRASSESEPPTPQSLGRANAVAIRFLEQWLSTPDDRGEEWWSSLEEELKSDREFEERDIQ